MSANTSTRNMRKRPAVIDVDEVSTPSEQKPSQRQRHRNGDANTSSNGQAPVNPLPQEPASKKKRRLNFAKPNAEFVEILVGEEEANFKLYKDAIVESSPHFKVIFNNKNGHEGESKILKLPDVEVEVFVIFSNWLNTDHIEDADIEAPDLLKLAKLWTKAGEWRIPVLQNQAMRLLLRLIHKPREALNQDHDNVLKAFYHHAYATKEHTCLKKLSVYKMANFITKLISRSDWIKDFPEDMMADVIEVFANRFSKLPSEHKHLSFKAADFLVEE